LSGIALITSTSVLVGVTGVSRRLTEAAIVVVREHADGNQRPEHRSIGSMVLVTSAG
jgi:hypothetical protein